MIQCQRTHDMIWQNIEIDRLKPICMFNVSKKDEIKQVFSWKKNQTLLKKFISIKGQNIIF